MSRRTTTFLKLLILVGGVLIILFGFIYLYFTFFYDQVVSIRNQFTFQQPISNEFYFFDSYSQRQEDIVEISPNQNSILSQNYNQIPDPSISQPDYGANELNNRGNYQDSIGVYSH